MGTTAGFPMSLLDMSPTTTETGYTLTAADAGTGRLLIVIAGTGMLILRAFPLHGIRAGCHGSTGATMWAGFPLLPLNHVTATGPGALYRAWLPRIPATIKKALTSRPAATSITRSLSIKVISTESTITAGNASETGRMPL